jgi:hypothetical protein
MRNLLLLSPALPPHALTLILPSLLAHLIPKGRRSQRRRREGRRGRRVKNQNAGIVTSPTIIMSNAPMPFLTTSSDALTLMGSSLTRLLNLPQTPCPDAPSQVVSAAATTVLVTTSVTFAPSATTTCTSSVTQMGVARSRSTKLVRLSIKMIPMRAMQETRCRGVTSVEGNTQVAEGYCYKLVFFFPCFLFSH